MMATFPILARAGQAGFGPILVVVGTVTEPQVATEVEVVGSVEPQLATTFSTEIAGFTQSIDLCEEEFVQKGKNVVAELTSAELELALNEAEAELAKARADLTKLKRGIRQEEIEEKRAEVAEKKAWVEKYAKNIERTKSLVMRDMVSISEFNQAEANYLAAKAQYERTLRSLCVAELGFRQEKIAAAEAEVQRLQAKVQRLREDVQKTVIRAPVSGFIINRYAEVGQWVERGGKVADIIDKRIEDTIVATQDRHTVYLRDIATVRFGLKKRDRSIRQLGDPTVGFGVVRRTGANTVKVMKGVKQELAYRNVIYADKGMQFEQAYDETDYIHDAVSLVAENEYEASLLTVIVLLFFLRSMNSILVIGLSIPVSVVTTCVVLNALGGSLNIVMLAGLAFAVVNVVGNSIAVLEDISRHREMGKARVQAALDGASEVWSAMLASTLTNLAVFLPIILMKDEVGQLFRDIAIATSVSTALSLGCALTIVPMMASRVLKNRYRGMTLPASAAHPGYCPAELAGTGLQQWRGA